MSSGQRASGIWYSCRKVKQMITRQTPVKQLLLIIMLSILFILMSGHVVVYASPAMWDMSNR